MQHLATPNGNMGEALCPGLASTGVLAGHDSVFQHSGCNEQGANLIPYVRKVFSCRDNVLM